MQLLDKDGNEMSSKAKDVEKFDAEFQEIIGKVVEKPSNKLQLLGSQNPQDYQQIISFAVQEINRILLYRLIKEVGKSSLNDIISSQDIDHLGSELYNAIGSGDKDESSDGNDNINPVDAN